MSESKGRPLPDWANMGLSVTEYVAHAIAKADGQIDFKSLPPLMKHEFMRYAEAAIAAYDPVRDAIDRLNAKEASGASDAVDSPSTRTSSPKGEHPL